MSSRTPRRRDKAGNPLFAARNRVAERFPKRAGGATAPQLKKMAEIHDLSERLRGWSVQKLK